MHRFEGVAIAALLVVALFAGGALVRVAALLGTPRAAVALAFVAVVVGGVTVAVLRSRRWVSSPYW